MVDYSHWRRDFNRWGAARFVHIRIMSLLKPWLTLFRLNTRRLAPVPLPTELPATYWVRIVTRDELVTAAGDPVMELGPAEFDDALARGDICAGVFDGDRLIAYIWRSFSAAPHRDGLWATFERPYRYGYKGFTHPDYRGQRLQDPVSHLTNALCIERGYPLAISLIESHNYASIVGSARRGNTEVGWAGYFKLFGRVYPFRSPGAKRHTFNFVRSSDVPPAAMR